MKVNLFDNNFAHVFSQRGYDASCYTAPSAGAWVRGLHKFDGVTVFTDEMCWSPLVESISSTTKFAWLMESPAVKPQIYQQIGSIQHKFDAVISFLDPTIAQSMMITNYVQCPLGGAWVQPIEDGVVKKTRLCSLIASTKRNLRGHALRHQIASAFSPADLYGSAYRLIEDKSMALDDYAFSVVIENELVPGYFTEKLIDALLRKVIPVYWGDPMIGKHFDTRGILSLDDLNSLSFDRYRSLLDSVQKNFEIAKNFKSSDDLLFQKIKELA